MGRRIWRRRGLCEFSGGKDSTVLLDLVRKLYPGIVAVFVDTGLEYPEIREFVKRFENVEWLKPKRLSGRSLPNMAILLFLKRCLTRYVVRDVI